MKSLYWRPQKVSRGLLLSVCVLSLLGLWLVETCPVPRYDRTHALKIRAAERAQKLMAAVRDERLRRGLTINSQFDPANTGLIGEPMSLVTTRPGDLRAKQTSCNPNFAAAVVQLLDQAGVRPGDTVAIGWSGSFPAMNLAVCAAVETMELRPIVLASATASQYGANHPEFFWLDMEHSLRQRQLVCLRSAAVSLGGAADRGWGLPSEAVSCIRAAIKRNDVPELGASSRAEAVQRRMQRYRGIGSGPADQGLHQCGWRRRFHRRRVSQAALPRRVELAPETIRGTGRLRDDPLCQPGMSCDSSGRDSSVGRAVRVSACPAELSCCRSRQTFSPGRSPSRVGDD